MKLQLSENANINYLSKIVDIQSFTKHPDPEVTRLKIAHVGGFNVVVGLDEVKGKFVYFPTMSCINPFLLRFANLYRCAELNENVNKTGLFEENGRVKAIRLRGVVSEGFLLPLSTFQSFILDSTMVKLTDEDCPDGLEFDEVVHGDKKFWISKKYIVSEKHTNSASRSSDKKKNRKVVKRFDRLIENQFAFHYDTVRIENAPTAIQPNDMISLTSKWHGTSFIGAYVLLHKPLDWKEKIARYLTKNPFDEYGYVYSSRSVIKNRYINSGVQSGFYDVDVWGEAMKYLQPFLIKGMTVYAEIVGYLPSGSFIQKGYDYGCVPMKTGEEYTCGTHYKLMVYRITLTNVSGIKHEFSAKEVQQWCKTNGLTPVIEYYYGYAKDLYPDIKQDDDWCKKFIERLANDKKQFYMECNSPECTNKVPHEGLVIKKEDGIPHAWKLKCFAFMDKEAKALDNGDANIEDNA